MAILDSPLSTIASFVRHLVLGGAVWGADTGEWQRATLPRLKVLFAVEVLEIRWIDFAMLKSCGQGPADFFDSFQMVKKLRLSLCNFGSFPDFATAFSYPPLEEVSLDRVEVPAMDDTIITPPSRIKSLQIHFIPTSTRMLTWLSSGGCTPSVQRLRFSLATCEDLPHIGNFMRSLGPSLKHFELAFCPWLEPDPQGTFVQFEIFIFVRT